MFRKWSNEITSSVTRSNFAPNLKKTQQKLTKFKMGYGEHALSRAQVLGGIMHFWMAVSVWKTNLVLEDLARRKRMNMWPKWGLSWGLIDFWQLEWSVLSWGPWTTQKKGSSCPARDRGHLDAASRRRPCHTATSVKECFTKKDIPVVLQPPYSPDLSPCDLLLFTKLKFHLKGRHFGTVDNIQKVVTDLLRALLHLFICVFTIYSH